MIITPDTAIKIAIDEVGYLEKSKEAYAEYPKCIYSPRDGAGHDNITKYGFEMHRVYPSTMDEFSYWCDTFVDWCFYTAYGISTAKTLLGGKFDDYTIASADAYKDKHAYYKEDPKAGDQVFFNNGSRIYHTGLVYKVDKIYIYTIEGNTSSKQVLEANGGCVAMKKYLRSYRHIDGYGRPRYDVPATCKPGDQNSDVMTLQKRLMLKGYQMPRYGADGDFGSETADAVKQFRVDNNLRISDKCDAECWERILKG